MAVGLLPRMRSSCLLAIAGLGAFCHGFAPAAMLPSCTRALQSGASSGFAVRAPMPAVRRLLRSAQAATVMQSDDLGAMFSGTEQLKFDMTWSDSENIRFDGTRATKTTDSAPAFAVFGNDNTQGVQKFGVRIVKQVNGLNVGVLVNPRTPSRPCFADTLRTPAVMIGKGGSVYRTGRLGTKMVEYLGPDLKKAMGKSYPPKFQEGDVVNIELNKDKQEVRMWINDSGAFTIGNIDKNAKFFVNMEGIDSSVELVRLN